MYKKKLNFSRFTLFQQKIGKGQKEKYNFLFNLLEDFLIKKTNQLNKEGYKIFSNRK